MSSTELLQKAASYLERKGRLKLWSGMMANQSLQAHMERQNKNQEAEDAFVRKTAWGQQSPPAAEPPDMGNTFLGDVTQTHPTPIVIAGAQQGSGLGKLLAGVALGTLIPAAGVGGFFASQLLQPKPPAAQPAGQPTTMTDETVDIGLGRLEDLLPAGSDSP